MSIGLRKNTKIALVHDWLLGVGGAEKTLKTLHEIFPNAPIYTLFHNKNFTNKFLTGADIRSTFIQNLYEKFRGHKFLTPLMPMAVESLNLSDFDLVISSSVIFSKGLILKPRTKHICYCYSPTRQIWDWYHEYLKEQHFLPKPWIAATQHFLRIWDRHASTRVDDFIAISENVRQRIRKYYGRGSAVIYPPVNIVRYDLSVSTNSKLQNFVPSSVRGIPNSEFFLIVSRLFKHKNLDLAVHAFNKLGWSLVIIGSGPELKKLNKIARSNIKFLGYQPDSVVNRYYANCLAFIMPQEEDFGITPIEAMSYGKPVLALRRGGALEYVVEGVNGEFFDDPVEEILADGVRRITDGIESGKYDPQKIKETAKRFSKDEFKRKILNYTLKPESQNSTLQENNSN